MASTPYLVPQPGAASANAEDRERVEDLLRTLNKAIRTHQLYKGRSPVLDRFVETLRGKIAAAWERFPLLTLQVDELEITWESERVYHAPERSDNLAFLFYKDGIRELTFVPGFENEDLLTFLSVLARLHRLRGEEDDLLTLLWELDLTYLRYAYVDTFTEGVDPLLKSGTEAPSLTSDLVRSDASQRVASVSTEDFQEALYFLDDAELRHLDAEVRREDARDLWGDVANALFDRLEDGHPERQAQIVGIVADLLPTLLGAGNFAKGAVILRELTAFAAPGSTLPPPVLPGIRAAFAQLGTREAIEELIRSTEEVPGAGSDEDLSEFLAFFPPESLGPLMRAEGVSTRPEVRKAISAAIERLATGHRDMVVQLLSDPDPLLLAGAARWVGHLGIGSAARTVARLLEHPEPSVRLAAIVALQELRTSVAAGALLRCLNDPVREVRVGAARALGTLRYSPAREALERAVTDRAIQGADLTERIALFEAYGSLAGSDGVPLLGRILNGRSWFGRREAPEIRACAALGLGKIDHPSASKALSAAAADPEAVVRSAVARALRPAAS